MLKKSIKILCSMKFRAAVINDIFRILIKKRDVYFVVEFANWVIRNINNLISLNLNNISSMVVVTHKGIRNSIVHFGSINTFSSLHSMKLPHKGNKTIVTWFHVSKEDPRIAFVAEANEHIAIWHTASNLSKQALVDIGIPADKIVVIPLGVDLGVFYQGSQKQKETIQERLGIPQGKIVIGSFQKDGNGWGEGLEPKLIKGPDVFCDVVERLSEKLNVFILLTGPARGYVKKRLEQANIPFLHHFLDDPKNLGDYYRALDLYIATARIEGGPQCVLESLASGVPLVTTRVGLAPDIIAHGRNGLLCEINNAEEIISQSAMLLQDSLLVNKLVAAGLATAKKYDWSIIAQRYQHELYEPLL